MAENTGTLDEVLAQEEELLNERRQPAEDAPIDIDEDLAEQLRNIHVCTMVETWLK